MRPYTLPPFEERVAYPFQQHISFGKTRGLKIAIAMHKTIEYRSFIFLIYDIEMHSNWYRIS